MDEKELLAGCGELTESGCASSSGIWIPVPGNGVGFGVTAAGFGSAPAATGVMTEIGDISFDRA